MCGGGGPTLCFRIEEDATDDSKVAFEKETSDGSKVAEAAIEIKNARPPPPTKSWNENATNVHKAVASWLIPKHKETDDDTLATWIGSYKKGGLVAARCSSERS